jgi:predicted metal-dependent hydrolase
MTRPEYLLDEVDPGPVQIQARKVQFDVSDTPLHWIPGHPLPRTWST